MMHLNKTILLCSIISISSLFVACKTIDFPKNFPRAIKNKISVNNKVEQVWEWKTDSKTYYYVVFACCDQFNYLYDTKGNIICAPDGGFSGKGDGKCPVFNEKIEKTELWHREKTSK
jgi:hypothetical protein